jgi:hypothetical protein
MRGVRLAVLFLTIVTLSFAQQGTGLTVDQVIAMSKAGLAEDVIIAKVQQTGKPFDLSVDDLLKLKQSGVSDRVVKQMLTPGPATAPTSTPVAPPLAAATVDLSAYPGIVEPGVYMKKGGVWVEVLPEVVNWRTGGVLKTIATAGVMKGDVNGNIEGPTSRNNAKTPLEFVIYTAEGVAVTEYQLLRLRVNRDYREFRTVTGGILHAKGGATRDLMPFEHKKVAARFYEVIFPPSISSGEYGFLPPGAFGSANSASIGKIYSFKIIE